MVLHLGVRRRLNRVSDMHVDNPANRDYSETRNYFESRVGPNALTSVACTLYPAYPLTATAGLTLSFSDK
jgi:hypothetical protein